MAKINKVLLERQTSHNTYDFRREDYWSTSLRYGLFELKAQFPDYQKVGVRQSVRVIEGLFQGFPHFIRTNTDSTQRISDLSEFITYPLQIYVVDGGIVQSRFDIQGTKKSSGGILFMGEIERTIHIRDLFGMHARRVIGK